MKTEAITRIMKSGLLKSVIFLVFSAVFIGLSTTVGAADDVSFDFTAQVTVVADIDNLLGGAINVNDTFTGRFTYDLDTLDSNSDPSVGDYWHYSVPYGISATINDLTFQTDPANTEFLVELVNRSTDHIVLRSYNNLFPVTVAEDHISWQLDDSSGTALSNTNLPTSLDLSLWEQVFGLTFDGNFGNFFIRAVIDTVDVAVLPPRALTVEVVGSGTTDPAPGSYTYDEGTPVSVDAIPDSGWTLDHWELDGVDVGSADPYSVTMDTDHILTAIFVEGPPVQYDLTISVVGSGTTDPAPGVHTYDEDTVVDVTAIPDSGWMLDHWELDTVDVGADQAFKVTMDADHTLTAVLLRGTVEIQTINHPVEVGGVTLHVTTESNSSVSDFRFNQTLKQITFNVAGSEGTVGLCDVTIPNDLLGDPFSVFIDGTSLPHELTQNATHCTLHLTYGHSTLTIRIEGTTAASPPTASFAYTPSEPVTGETVTFDASGSYDPDGTIAIYNWNFGDGATSTEAEQTATHTYMETGTYDVTLTVTDNAGFVSNTYSDTIILRAHPVGGLGYIDLAIIGAAVGAMGAGLVVVYKIKKKPKKPPTERPAKLTIQAEPTKIAADGRSKSTITIQLLDKKGNPIIAPADTEVRLAATRGKIESPLVTIPKGEETGKTVLISSTESGTVTLSTTARGLKGITVTLEFEEKPRFCMGCGKRLPAKAVTCKKCGVSPADFGGLETRTCHCGAVIPATAKFCSECGAKQAPTER